MEIIETPDGWLIDSHRGKRIFTITQREDMMKYLRKCFGGE